MKTGMLTKTCIFRGTFEQWLAWLASFPVEYTPELLEMRKAAFMADARRLELTHAETELPNSDQPERPAEPIVDELTEWNAAYLAEGHAEWRETYKSQLP